MRAGFDYGATIFLVALQVMLSVFAVVIVFFSAFDVSCVGSRCNYGLKGVAIQLMFWSSIAFVPITLIWIAARRHRNEVAATAFVPVVSIGVLGVIALACAALNAAAVDKLPFG